MSKLARKFRELIQLKPRASAPSDPEAGDIWVESGSPSRLYVYNGQAAEEVTGSVAGPADETTDNAIVRWNGTDGLSIQDSAITIDDSSNMAGIATLTATTVTATTVNATNVAGTITTATQAQINHDSLLNFLADEHVPHSSVTLTAGAGLSGGGTIAANRTFAVNITSQTLLSSADAGDELLVSDSDSGNAIKKVLIQGLYDGIHGPDVFAQNQTTVPLADNQSSPVEIINPDATNTAIVIEYSLSRGAANIECGQLFITNDGTTASVSTASSSVGTLGVTFSADVDSGAVRLLYTSTNTGTAPSFKYTIRQWAA